MSSEETFGSAKVIVTRGDITELPVEAFVFHARPDLILGSGFGTAISVRGGPAIQAELRKVGGVAAGDAVVTGGGNLRAKYIIHAVGPRFQEEDIEAKLRTTTLNALKRASEKGVRRIGFPALGSGFYGVPLDVGAKVVLSATVGYLLERHDIEEVVFCLVDSRECRVYEAQLAALAGRSARS